MARHRPNGCDVEQGHTHANQHCNHQEALAASEFFCQRQRYERVKPESHLRAGGMFAAVNF